MATNPDPWAEFKPTPAPAPAPSAPRKPTPVYGAPKQPAPITAPQAQDMNINAAEEDRKRREWEATHKPDGTPIVTPKGGDPKENARAIVTSLGIDLTGDNDRISDLIRASTSGGLEKMGADAYSFVMGDATSGMEAIGTLTPISADLTLQMTGGSLGSQISNADRDFIKERMGDIANPDKTADVRLAAWREVKRRLANTLGVETSGQNGDAADRDDDQGGAVKVHVPPMTGDLPTGTEVVMGEGLRPGDSFDEDAFYKENYNLTRNQAATVEAVLNANLRNKGITGADLEAAVKSLGIPTERFDWDAMAAQINAGDFTSIDGKRPKRSRFKFPVDEAERAKKAGLDKEIAARGVNPETTGRAAMGHALEGASLGFGDEIAGAVAGIGAAAQGENPIDAYQNERDITRRKLERSAEYAPKTALVSEIAGGLATGPLGFRRAGVAAGEAALARTAAKEAGTFEAANAAKAAQRNAVLEMGRSGATVGGVAGVGYGEGEGSLASGVTGAVLGGAGGAAMQSTAPLVGKFLGKTGSQRAVDNADEVVAAGREFDVPVMTTDVRPPRSALGKKIKQSFPEAIPLAGTGGKRAAQQEARTEAGKSLLREYGGNPEFNPFESAPRAVDDVAANLSETRLSEIKRLTAQKDDVIDGTQGLVQSPQAIAAIDQQIARVSRLPGMEGVVQKLQGWRDALSAGRSLREVEDIRKIMGEAFAGENLGDIRGVGQKAVNAIYDPLRSDMAKFINANGGRAALTKWKNANGKLSAMAGELEDRVFRSILRDAEATPENVAKMMFSAKPSSVQRLYANLGEEGRRRMQAGLIQEAFNRSIRADSGFSVDAFATNLQKLGTPIGVAFEKVDAERIQGFIRLIRSTKRASEAAASPPTGAQNTPLAMGYAVGSLFGHAAIPVTGALGMLARAYESAPVRNLLLRLSRTKEGSQQEKTIINQITKLLSVGNEGGIPRALNDNLMTSAAAGEQQEQ